MKVTPELIEKYHLGTCTEKEKQAIEEWLSSDAEESGQLSEQTLLKMETNVWDALATHFPKRQTPVISIYNSYVRYAACLVMAMMVAAFYYAQHKQGFAKTITYENAQDKAIEALKDNTLKLKIMPKSKLSTKNAFWNPNTEIKCCGTVVFTNLSDDDMPLLVQSSCDSKFCQKLVHLKNTDRCVFYTSLTGRSYLIENNNPYSLPPADWNRMNKII